MPTSNVYNGANQMGATTYDGAGNQLAFGGTVLTYDAENRLTSETDPPAAGGGTFNYIYDGLGRRITKATSAGATVYIYDGLGRLDGRSLDSYPIQTFLWQNGLCHSSLGDHH